MNTKIEISYKTIIITILILVGGWLVYQIRDILYLLFIAFLLMTALHPLIELLDRIRIPRIIGIMLVYLIVFGVFGVIIISSIPALIIQTTRLTQDLPGVITRMLPYWNVDFNTISQQIAPIGENVLKVTLGIFSNIATTVTVLVFTFYFLLERQRARFILTDMFGESIAKQAIDILRVIESRLGAWVRGELLLMVAVGVFSYIGLSILHVDYALPLAIVAGVLEIVPNIGPIVSAIPAILVGLGTSPLLALSVAALYFLVQQIENNLLVPIIMKKSVGFSPLVTILALLIGARLAGIAGMVLAVPITLVIQVVILKLLIKKNPSK